MNSGQQWSLQPGLLRLQSSLSPAFPTGGYSYSHGIEWAVEAGLIKDRTTLIDWLEADLCFGSGRNEAIFASLAWRCGRSDDRSNLLEVAELATAFRGTSELALESLQQGSASLAILRQVWPDPLLEWLSVTLEERGVQPTVAIVLGIHLARQDVPLTMALPAFLQSYIANLASAGVRLIPLGQTDGQRAIAELERSVLYSSAQAQNATTDDLGSAAIMVELASMAHETQYTRLFRS